MDRSTREQAEIDFWATDPQERPGPMPVDVLVKKMSEARVFLECLARFSSRFEAAQTIVELGGGQGWASCIVKARYPNARVVATDISQYALASLPEWARILNTTVDDSFACKSDSTGLPDESVDLVFAFAAAHHFASQADSLREIKRILKPGGQALYLYEPATPRLLYGPAFRRVNRKRPQVLEDVLIIDDVRRAARRAGLRCRVDYFPSLADRRPFEFLYYLALTAVRPLQRVMPCTVNLSFTKGS
jgi:SAM-dependent methyltransferase